MRILDVVIGILKLKILIRVIEASQVMRESSARRYEDLVLVDNNNDLMTVQPYYVLKKPDLLVASI